MIELTDSVIDNRYCLIRGNNKVCTNCSNKVRKLYNYHNLPHQLCELCNIVHRYCTRTMYTGIMCISDLTQIEITNKTYLFLKNNKRIPKISEIDKNAKLIDFSFPDLLKAMKNANEKQKKDNFSSVRLFFSDIIDYDAFPFTSMFWRPVKYPEYQFFDIVKNDSGIVKLNYNQMAIVNLYIDEPDDMAEYLPEERVDAEKVVKRSANIFAKIRKNK
jgi:hypothetical protein